MLKMFTTQLSGLFKRLYEKEEEAIEDSARILAQALGGEGKIFICATNEMKAVVAEALYSSEPLQGAEEWTSDHTLESISPNDRFLFFSRTSDDQELLPFGQTLTKEYIPFVSVSTIMSADSPGLHTKADVHIDLKLTKGLLPDDEGNRFGYPASIAALFVYYGIKFTLDEFIKEYEL